MPTQPQQTKLVGTGQIVGRNYEVIRAVGRGGMATVYMVRHLGSGELFAMKVLNNELLHVDEAKRRFEREATALSKLSHPNLVTLYDFGVSDDGQPYFITDFLQGSSLFNILRQERRLSVDRACRIFVQICEGMEYAHQRGLIHRDLKPSNILLTGDAPNERVKIVDFGIVKFAPTEQRLDERLTQEGMVVGSPAYMSPEQCQNHNLDHRTDIYSLGCIMFEVLTGRLAFEGDYPLAILIKQVSAPAPTVHEAMTDDDSIGASIEAVILKTLSKLPEHRHQSMSELQFALSQALKEQKPLVNQ